jgi:hypothetical protein
MLNLVMIRPSGIEAWVFLVLQDPVCSEFAPFSASTRTDTGSKSIDCALASTLESYYDPGNGNYFYFLNFLNHC